MDFTVEKYPEVIDSMGNIMSTLVLIRNGSFLCIPASFEGNLMTCTDIELTKMVLDDFYNRMYPNKAENESFARVNEALEKANETIKKNDEVNKVTRQALADMSTTVYNNADLIEQLAQHVGFELPNEEGDEEDGTSEQSDSGSETHNETEGGE